MPRRNQQLKLDIEKIENLVADRLAEILVRQLEYIKIQAKEQNKNKYEKKMENQFITSDFYTAVFLLAREYKLVGINKTDPRRFCFVFDDQKGRAELLEDFFNGATAVEPRGFIAAIKELKSLMYSGDVRSP